MKTYPHSSLWYGALINLVAEYQVQLTPLFPVMDVQQLEFQLPDQIEQALSSAGLMYFTYNRGIKVNDSTVTANIELKGSKHAFKITLLYDRSAHTAQVKLDESEGEAPAGNFDKITQVICALPAELKALLS